MVPGEYRCDARMRYVAVAVLYVCGWGCQRSRGKDVRNNCRGEWRFESEPVAVS